MKILLILLATALIVLLIIVLRKHRKHAEPRSLNTQNAEKATTINERPNASRARYLESTSSMEPDSSRPLGCTCGGELDNYQGGTGYCKCGYPC